MSINNEEIIWSLFLQGDTNAFSLLFKKYYSSLYNYGLKLCNNSCVTEDCLQTFFVYLHDNRKTIGDVKNVKSYLFISFRRALFTSLKKERNFTDFNSEKQNSNSFAFSPEELKIDQEISFAQTSSITLILNTLSPREREVIYLKYYGELSMSEIATTMDISYQSVLNTLQKAFSKIRKTIENNMLSAILKK
ncbi:sigma-70 family RNA polymerase sigma factor [Cellulophaga sp. E16_2]|uniref:RNA polymerase, sigma-24 subunit, ECF subfamily n=1 Tax=Cellulophaga algicola (strain DSM 14237 / IC166 / ACAM 630) TaxID=688270 RepID=E6XFG5_CELAD|nr:MULTISPECIES: sigma-70 family RNA polymerase sigma factor [Cellulophaga]ADV51438.1 RNA polymerase, sigma-24 subunit, ECF subfamily [Cellulophaga algicola DSM 14237]MBO0593811.1 sigma-70 family RNA polymerase sigma factor [Cellulophaga sp. E16_2]